MTACYIMAGSGGTATGAWGGGRSASPEWRSYFPGAGSGAGWLAWFIDEAALYSFNGTIGSSPVLSLVNISTLRRSLRRRAQGPTWADSTPRTWRASPSSPSGTMPGRRPCSAQEAAAQAQGTASSIIPTSVSRRAARHSPAQAIFRTMTEPICSTAPCCSQTATTSPMSIKSSPPFLSAPTQRPRSRWRPRTRNSASCFPSKRETPDRLSAAQPRSRSRHARAAATRRSARCAQRSYPGRGPRM